MGAITWLMSLMTLTHANAVLFLVATSMLLYVNHRKKKPSWRPMISWFLICTVFWVAVSFQVLWGAYSSPSVFVSQLSAIIYMIAPASVIMMLLADYILIRKSKSNGNGE